MIGDYYNSGSSPDVDLWSDKNIIRYDDDRKLEGTLKIGKGTKSVRSGS